MRRIHAALAGAMAAMVIGVQAQQYQPNIDSLKKHQVPEWFSDAKLGVMVVWGPYSVPGWAPLAHKNHDFSSPDYLKNDPYAEWYDNALRIPGSPTAAYHKQHYGEDFDYYQFAGELDKQSRDWKPDLLAAQLKDAGMKYVIFTTKFHDGYAMWPSAVVNVNRRGMASKRDYTGELTTAVRKSGMKMGIYYSGLWDWTFGPGPVMEEADYAAHQPETLAYGQYADAQIEELINTYHPSVLFGDMGWPKRGHVMQVIADYYNRVPDGVINDRWSLPQHNDFEAPEYWQYDQIRPEKWQHVRGLGASFGYNRNEGEEDTIAPADLINLLVDVVSKNGGLILGVGLEGDGSISPVQLERLQELGAWLKINGDAIYGTRPWIEPATQTGDGLGVRFTQKNGALYATLLGRPKGRSLVLNMIGAKPGTTLTMLGVPGALKWTQEGQNLRVDLPQALPGSYACVLRFDRLPVSTIRFWQGKGLRQQMRRWLFWALGVCAVVLALVLYIRMRGRAAGTGRPSTA
jgi:alpha-L-fucosidase